jgi:hypothetical protein
MRKALRVSPSSEFRLAGSHLEKSDMGDSPYEKAV